MTTRQLSRGLALSPSTVVHRVTLEYRANDVDAVTACGVDVDVRTWERVYGVDRRDSLCENCFTTDERRESDRV